MLRRTLIRHALQTLASGSALLSMPLLAQGGKPLVEVWKDPSCGCCKDWVPAREIKRLLKERPKALGLAVPGMPVGSPGMDGPAYGGRKDPYAVLMVQADGRHQIFQNYA